MFRLVEQTCHRFKRRGKEWFLFGQLIGSWSAPFDGPKWHLCWRQKRLIDPCSDIVTLSATVVKCIFYETLYRVESLESAHFSLISNKEGVFLLTFLFENFIFTECTNCFYWTFFNVAFGDHSFQKWKWGKRKWMRKEHLLSYIRTALRNFQTAWDLKTMKCKALNISWLFSNNQKEWKF